MFEEVQTVYLVLGSDDPAPLVGKLIDYYAYSLMKATTPAGISLRAF